MIMKGGKAIGFRTLGPEGGKAIGDGLSALKQLSSLNLTIGE